MTRGLVNAIWFGRGPLAGAARTALWPAAAAYRAATALRNRRYDRGASAVERGPIPAVAVGNLTVGGTGKTPVAAWLAAELAARGARPAIVLRGYGADEPLVHERLNPGVPVVVSPDRVAGVLRAASLGATAAVLDDAFQHRRAARVADLVLISAERGLTGARLLPAGPYRELPAALRRATLVVVTRKTASAEHAEAVLRDAERYAGKPGAVMSLLPGALIPVAGGDPVPLGALAGRTVLLATGVGEPDLVASQLSAAGAEVRLRAFADHHAFTDAELAALAGEARGAEYAVCTLKDAVKIGARWPGPAPLWYVSQTVTVERGAALLEAVFASMLAAITENPSTAG
ncbi:MAG: tetraacyldisaccharide 4'-kinase [Gemmatimonadota bacterium]|nr:tetraacyldisaccharide 4'-kinase [Gemmatimonadota bacterium]